METEFFAIMFILVVLAVIYALVSGTRGRTNKDDEEKLKVFKDLLKETDEERRRRADEAANTITDIIMIAILLVVITALMMGVTATPA